MDLHIKNLQKSVRPGFKRLNWNSLGIQEYISKNDEVFGNNDFTLLHTFLVLHTFFV